LLFEVNREQPKMAKIASVLTDCDRFLNAAKLKMWVGLLLAHPLEPT